MTAYSLILAADAARANVAWVAPSGLTPPITPGTGSGARRQPSVASSERAARWYS